jgi:hypothetical protein
MAVFVTEPAEAGKTQGRGTLTHYVQEGWVGAVEDNPAQVDLCCVTAMPHRPQLRRVYVCSKTH